MNQLSPLSQAFLNLRPRLFALAYRITKSATDAEDIVQDAYVVAEGVPTGTVREPEPYLVRIVTNRSLAVIAEKQQTVYPGPDLPEPLQLDRMPGLAAIDLSYTLLVLLSRLTPMERAVFLLKETMDYSYDHIADFLSISNDHCRQLQHRAKIALSSRAGQGKTSPEKLQNLLNAFQQAVSTGDVAELLGWLHEDIVIQADGGGKRPAALKPILGRQACVAYLTSLYQKWSDRLTPDMSQINGEAGLLLRNTATGELETVMLFQFRENKLEKVYLIHNPDKLRRFL